MKRGREANDEHASKNANTGGSGLKSELTQLAEKFKQQFCQEARIGKDVNLNDVTDVLQVSRRRLYDIVGVLEACQMVSRSGKLTYRWEGTAHLPRLLDLLYADAVSAGERGQQGSMAILEGHMPGSCWALTRRIVQQLLLDRGMVPLTLLVQRLDATMAAMASSSVGRSSLATVERRIYDIGSVLSTFGLVTKTLQGGSGPRHRQPVYQWVFAWDSMLPPGLPEPGSEAALAAAVARYPPGDEEAGAPNPTFLQPAALLLPGATQLTPLHGVLSPSHSQAGGVSSSSMQWGLQDAGAAGDAHNAAAAAGALPAAKDAAGLQQRLQQVEQLVRNVLAQHGPQTCVTLAELKSLLDQIKQGTQGSHEDQGELDAAASLAQLQTGNDSPLGATAEQHQQLQLLEQLLEQQLDQQQFSSGAEAAPSALWSDVSHGMHSLGLLSRLPHRGSGTAAAAASYAEQQQQQQQQQQQGQQLECKQRQQQDWGLAAALGGSSMGGLQALAQLRSQFQQRYDADDEQQEDEVQHSSGADAAVAAAAVGAAAGDDMLEGGVEGSAPSNDHIDDAADQDDCEAFVAGDDAELDLRAGSNQMNNSQQEVIMKQLAAAAVAGLQHEVQHGHGQGDNHHQQQQQAVWVNEEEKGSCKETAGQGAAAAAAAAAAGQHRSPAMMHSSNQQQHTGLELPWLRRRVETGVSSQQADQLSAMNSMRGSDSVDTAAAAAAAAAAAHGSSDGLLKRLLEASASRQSAGAGRASSFSLGAAGERLGLNGAHAAAAGFTQEPPAAAEFGVGAGGRSNSSGTMGIMQGLEGVAGSAAAAGWAGFAGDARLPAAGVGGAAEAAADGSAPRSAGLSGVQMDQLLRAVKHMQPEAQMALVAQILEGEPGARQQQQQQQPAMPVSITADRTEAARLLAVLMGNRAAAAASSSATLRQDTMQQLQHHRQQQAQQQRQQQEQWVMQQQQQQHQQLQQQQQWHKDLQLLNEQRRQQEQQQLRMQIQQLQSLLSHARRSCASSNPTAASAGAGQLGAHAAAVAGALRHGEPWAAAGPQMTPPALPLNMDDMLANHQASHYYHMGGTGLGSNSAAAAALPAGQLMPAAAGPQGALFQQQLQQQANSGRDGSSQAAALSSAAAAVAAAARALEERIGNAPGSSSSGSSTAFAGSAGGDAAGFLAAVAAGQLGPGPAALLSKLPADVVMQLLSSDWH